MKAHQTTIYRYGVSQVESALASDAPDLLPRRDPTSTTSRTVRRKWETGLSNRTAKFTTGHTTKSKTYLPSSGRKNDKPSKLNQNKKCETLNIVQFNASGLFTKKTEFAYYLNKNNIHIALIQETEKGKDSDIHISGYTPTHCACKKCQGTITYIRNDITGRTENLQNNNPTCIQKSTIWLSNRKYVIYNVYNHPATNLIIPPTLNENKYQNTIIVGDFNGHSPSWGYENYNCTGKNIEELANTSNLFIVQDSNSPPTLLHRAHKTLSRPDLTLLSSDLLESYQSQVTDMIGNSDHRPIFTKIFLPGKAKFKQRTRWNFKKAHWNLYKETSDKLLTEIDMDNNDIDKINKDITTAILKAASLSIPKGYRKKYKPFWTESLSAAVKTREKARKNIEANPTIQNRTAYNRASAEVKLMTNKLKREKFKSTCKNLDLARDGNKAWSLIRNLSGENRNVNPKPLYNDNETIASEQKRANIQNKHFASITKSNKLSDKDKALLKNLKLKEKEPKANIRLFEEDFTFTEITKSILKLKKRKSPGPDSIHNEMLINLGNKGKMILLHFFNLIWKMGKLPLAWKNAIIKPILKKGKPADDVKSYRPISLTSCLGKMAERMINERLYWWLEANKLLDSHQAGFRARQRTDDQLFRLTQKVIDGFHMKKNTTAIFVDLQEAFDRVWRKGLLYKMQDLGIHGKLYRWIKSFLSERNIQTKINNAFSSKETLEEGLPQGSSLSATLFLIFVNDLPGQLKYEKALYADDLALWHTHEEVGVSKILLNEELNRIKEYCDKWKLKINSKKSVYTIFTKSSKTANKTLDLHIGGNLLTKEENPVYLGVKLDTQISLKDHIQHLGNKSTRRLKILKRLASTQWGTDKRTLRQLYLGYVRSTLESNLPLQVLSSDTSQTTLDRIESQAVHFITGAMRSAPTDACHIDADIVPLRLRREAAAIEMTERYLRKDDSNPNFQIVKNWKPNHRIKQKSIMKVSSNLQTKFNISQNREKELPLEEIPPPFTNQQKAEINLEINSNLSKKTTDPTVLNFAGLDTIQNFPEDWTHIYTDGSASNGTKNAGYGVRIEYPDKSCTELSNPCGVLCSNFDAEAKAVVIALQEIKENYNSNNENCSNIVVFTDSKSVLQALENKKNLNHTIEKLKFTIDDIISTFSVQITLQWIPSHCDLPGNEAADRLAKKGTIKEQPDIPISQNTCKQIIKENIKTEWLNNWAKSNTGRSIYSHQKEPNPKDPINSLERREQVVIYRLRTQHIQLNAHLNRIKPDHSPVCPLCHFPYETVTHFLFECQELQDLRQLYLPPEPNLGNTLYSTLEQLEKTSQYYNMANRRRANAQVTAGSTK